METPFVTVPQALEELSQGRMIVVVDDEDRENEGDLTLAAEFVTPESINFMAKHGRGLICLTLTEDRADTLRLRPMTQVNTSRFGTAFTESIEAREGVTTGISAWDRAHTIQVAISPRTTSEDLARPGHVFPLRARNGGVLVRAGQTEASVDLARMAGLTPAGVICEILKEDGTMARVPDLIEFCRQHEMGMLTVAELIRYRLRTERYVRRVTEKLLPTEFGDFNAIHFTSTFHGEDLHSALVMGDISSSEPVLVRVHSHCLHGDVFGSTLCECGRSLRQSLERIAREGRGVLVYLRKPEQSSCGEELFTAFPNEVHESVPEETLRQIGLGSQILSDLGVRKIRLLTRSPKHIPALNGFGLEIVDHVPLTREENMSMANGTPFEASLSEYVVTAEARGN